MNLLEIMKKAGIGAVEATNPVAIISGQVLDTHPLSVLVDQRFVLPEEILLIPEGMREHKLMLGTEEYIIRKALAKDDRILLMRVQGGHQYIVLDRVVSE